MNNQSSSGSQIFRFLLLGLAGFFLWNSFNSQQTREPAVPPRAAPQLVEAFNNIAPDRGVPLDQTTAPAEIGRLQKLAAANPKDDLALWSQLRIGLIQQYVTGDLKEAQRAGGILGLGAKVTYFPAYDAVIQQAKGDAIDAQAHYQVGDLLWRRSVAQSQEKKASGEAVGALQTLVTKGRGASEFLDQQIYVPKSTVGQSLADPRNVPLEGVPPGGFKSVKVRDLHGTLETPIPAGIIDRVDKYYEDSTYYKIFDMMVQVFGRNPTYSYGLAILVFAIFTRTVMQPIYRRQYDSMKGMALIGPEMKKIQEKYKENKDPSAQMAMMKEIRGLQSRHGVNPMMGCGLALLQMPIFFFVVYPMIQHYEPHMELVGASFLWIQALARPDIPLLILYGISMFFSFRLSSTPPADDMQRQQQMIMSFMMPVLFPFFLIAYPSAFTLYWMTYNVISTIFQWRLMKAANPDKNMLKTLMGADLIAVNPAADAVPARPGSSNNSNGSETKTKKEKPALESGKASLDLDKIAGSNGHLNGASKNETNGSGGLSNGSAEHHAAPEGSVLKPSSNGTKRGGRRGKKKR